MLFQSFEVRWGVLLLLLITSCNVPETAVHQNSSDTLSSDTTSTLTDSVKLKPSSLTTDEATQAHLGQGYDFEGNGKDLNGPHFEQLFEARSIQARYVLLSAAVRQGLRQQLAYLNRFSKNRSYGTWNRNDLKQVLQHLLSYQADTVWLDSTFHLLQSAGEDSLGNVHFTGYYSPVISARSRPEIGRAHV